MARPATGAIWIDGVAHDLPKPHSFATMDHGRGRWPYDARWNWGAGSGFDGVRRMGLQVGGRWTDGTGVVHIAPAFGEDDSRVGREWELPFLQLVDARALEKLAAGQERIQALIEGKTVVKVIAVPGKLVNIVVK